MFGAAAAPGCYITFRSDSRAHNLICTQDYQMLNQMNKHDQATDILCIYEDVLMWLPICFSLLSVVHMLW